MITIAISVIGESVFNVNEVKVAIGVLGVVGFFVPLVTIVVINVFVVRLTYALFVLQYIITNRLNIMSVKMNVAFISDHEGFISILVISMIPMSPNLTLAMIHQRHKTTAFT